MPELPKALPLVGVVGRSVFVVGRHQGVVPPAPGSDVYATATIAVVTVVYFERFPWPYAPL